MFGVGNLSTIGHALLLVYLLGEHRCDTVSLRRVIFKPEKHQTTSDVFSFWVFLDRVLRIQLDYLLEDYCP